MPIVIDDTTNPAAYGNSLNLKQILSSFAFILKEITGQSNWKIPPSVSLENIPAGTVGDKGFHKVIHAQSQAEAPVNNLSRDPL
ncbi:hypothetical protein [Tolypothrix sp. VBCCA 56010]|uniref:hypothetical protein n=1 Tax=Tolypothrix sp. VBCCA 56010 TaxID=3137731 RepID=UPI003D7E5A9B